MKNALIAVLIFFATTFSVARDTKAQGAIEKLNRRTAGSPTAELMLSYGFDDIYKLGFGARAGIDGIISSIPNLYIGGVFSYHLGSSVTAFGNTFTTNALYGGADVGYNILLDGNQLLLRPSAYVGVASFTTGGTVNPFTGTSSGTLRNNEFLLAPGATLYFPVIDGVTIGVDGRFFVVSNASTFSLGATIGKSF
jgi:hypothetical protein